MKGGGGGIPSVQAAPCGSCSVDGGQIKCLFPLSGEQLDTAPLIPSRCEPLAPWITVSLGAPEETSGHAPPPPPSLLRSMPRRGPQHPSLTRPCTARRGWRNQTQSLDVKRRRKWKFTKRWQRRNKKSSWSWSFKTSTSKDHSQHRFNLLSALNIVKL